MAEEAKRAVMVAAMMVLEYILKIWWLICWKIVKKLLFVGVDDCDEGLEVGIAVVFMLLGRTVADAVSLAQNIEDPSNYS